MKYHILADDEVGPEVKWRCKWRWQWN